MTMGTRGGVGSDTVVRMAAAWLLTVSVTVIGAAGTHALAAEVRVAVAANFLTTLKTLGKDFTQKAGHALVISAGSSGKLYAHIQHGAPFDIFLSADAERPRRLEQKGLIVPGSRITYAIGRLMLWSRDAGLVDEQGSVLAGDRYQHLALANPKTAPYGRAAKQALEALGYWNHVKSRVVQGESIAQAFQFVFSENADLGLVARSQVMNGPMAGMGSRWEVPEELHAPLRQQAVLLNDSRRNPAAREFWEFLQGAHGRAVIERFGYRVE